MTTTNSHNYPQLTSTTFTSRMTGTDSDDEDQADAIVAPQTTTIRVTRPVDPVDFVLPRPILSQKELYDLAYRYVLLYRTKRILLPSYLAFSLLFVNDSRPAALNTRVTCRICRYRDGFDKLYPQYKLYIEHLATGEIHHVLTAKKQRKSQTSYYTITGTVHLVDSNQPGAFLTEEVVLGKVRSNFLGTSFCIYSHGTHPDKQGSSGNKELPIREELGAVLYVS